MSDLTGWEKAALEARESEQRSAETLLRQLTVPFDLDRVAAWVEDPVVRHHPLAQGVLRALIAEVRRLKQAEHDLLNEQQRRVGRMHAEAALLRSLLQQFLDDARQDEITGGRLAMLAEKVEAKLAGKGGAG